MKEAEKGEGRSMYFLGACYREGFGHVGTDEGEAMKWFERGKAAGDPLAALSTFSAAGGNDMWDVVNTYFPEVLLAANRGDVAAMDEAGRFYLSGGLLVDFEEGVKWLTKASLFEYWRSLYELGVAYQEGIATEQNSEKAELCFEKAAAFHDSRASFALAEDCLMREDVAKAKEWLEKSWEDGNAEAAYRLGLVYDSSEEEPDGEKAFLWYGRAAEGHIPEAKAGMAFYYEKGIVVEKDRATAERLYREAAMEGDDESWLHLALSALEEKDEEAGFRYMVHAAESGIRKAKYMAGMMYLEGTGCEPDREEGVRWLEEAADEGSEEAETALNRLRSY